MAERMDPQALDRLLRYDPDTGGVFWRHSRGRVPAGARAGTPNVRGHRVPTLDGKKTQEHRVIWALYTGRWPKAEIDHIKGDRADNRWSNLREATRAENQRNVGRISTNTSGFKGVSWHKRARRWRAEISGGGYTHLGLFDTPQEAAQAYRAAAAQRYGEYVNFGAAENA